jgi:hypothetical protein
MDFIKEESLATTITTTVKIPILWDDCESKYILRARADRTSHEENKVLLLNLLA